MLDNFSTGLRQNLQEFHRDIELMEGDLRDAAACRAACRRVETVFHLGALGSVPRSIEDPATSNAVNVTGTLNLLQAAQEAGVRRVVFSSSSSVYGDTPTLPKHEEMRPLPRSPYAVSKLAGEEYCRVFFQTYGLETLTLRYFNVFGPRQRPDSAYAAVIPRFVSALLNGRRPVLYGSGLQSRDFTFVANVVKANLLAAEAPEAAGQAVNVACGEQITVREVLDAIAAQLGVSCDPEFHPARAGDVQRSQAAIAAARQLLGYAPEVFFREGLARTVRAYVAAEAPLADPARRLSAPLQLVG